MVGSEVELSCVDFKENAFDLNELHVYWQITVNGKTKTVAYYLSENSSAVYVDAQYKGRAQLSQAGMRHGDFSLRLRNVTPQDEQKFNCLVFKKFERALNVTVALHVAGEGAGVAVASPQPRGPGGAGGPGSSREAKPGSAAGSRVTVCEAERAGSPPARRNAACGPGRPRRSRGPDQSLLPLPRTRHVSSNEIFKMKFGGSAERSAPGKEIRADKAARGAA